MKSVRFALVVIMAMTLRGDSVPPSRSPLSVTCHCSSARQHYRARQAGLLPPHCWAGLAACAQQRAWRSCFKDHELKKPQSKKNRPKAAVI